MGIGVSSHSSSIEDAQADRVRRKAEREGLKRSHQPPEPQTGTPEVSPSPSLVGRSGGIAARDTLDAPAARSHQVARSEGGVAAAPPPGVLVPGEAPGFHDAAQTARRPVPATTATSSRPSADVRHDLGAPGHAPATGPGLGHSAPAAAATPAGAPSHARPAAAPPGLRASGSGSSAPAGEVSAPGAATAGAAAHASAGAATHTATGTHSAPAITQARVDAPSEPGLSAGGPAHTPATPQARATGAAAASTAAARPGLCARGGASARSAKPRCRCLSYDRQADPTSSRLPRPLVPDDRQTDPTSRAARPGQFGRRRELAAWAGSAPRRTWSRWQLRSLGRRAFRTGRCPGPAG